MWPRLTGTSHLGGNAADLTLTSDHLDITASYGTPSPHSVWQSQSRSWMAQIKPQKVRKGFNPLHAEYVF
jgi:hypothetical protein